MYFQAGKPRSYFFLRYRLIVSGILDAKLTLILSYLLKDTSYSYLGIHLYRVVTEFEKVIARSFSIIFIFFFVGYRKKSVNYISK